MSPFLVTQEVARLEFTPSAVPVPPATVVLHASGRGRFGFVMAVILKLY